MFSGDRQTPPSADGLRAGVTAYIVDELAQERIEPILAVAIERFNAQQELKQELGETKLVGNAQYIDGRRKVLEFLYQKQLRSAA